MHMHANTPILGGTT